MTPSPSSSPSPRSSSSLDELLLTPRDDLWRGSASPDPLLRKRACAALKHQIDARSPRDWGRQEMAFFDLEGFTPVFPALILHSSVTASKRWHRLAPFEHVIALGRYLIIYHTAKLFAFALDSCNPYWMTPCPDIKELSTDGALLLAIDRSRQIHVFNPHSGQCLQKVAMSPGMRFLGPYQGCISPQGILLRKTPFAATYKDFGPIGGWNFSSSSILPLDAISLSQVRDVIGTFSYLAILKTNRSLSVFFHKTAVWSHYPLPTFCSFPCFCLSTSSLICLRDSTSVWRVELSNGIFKKLCDVDETAQIMSISDRKIAVYQGSYLYEYEGDTVCKREVPPHFRLICFNPHGEPFFYESGDSTRDRAARSTCS